MSSTMHIPALETGVIRLFVLDLPEDQIAGFTTPTSEGDDMQWPLKDALGAKYLDAKFVETFPIGNLEGLGLAGYLMEGNDVPIDQIDPMRPQLNQLSGHVMLVSSSAFGGFAQSLQPAAPLRHIATFFTQGTPVTFKPLPDDSAQLGSGADEMKPAKKQPSQAAMMGRIATYALLFMFAITGLVIWIGS